MLHLKRYTGLLRNMFSSERAKILCYPYSLIKVLPHLKTTFLQERRGLRVVYKCNDCRHVVDITTFAFFNAHMPVDAAFCQTAKHPTLLHSRQRHHVLTCSGQVEVVLLPLRAS